MGRHVASECDTAGCAKCEKEAQAANEPTLNEALRAAGYRSEPIEDGHYRRRIICEATGAVVGDMNAAEAWAWLHKLEVR